MRYTESFSPHNRCKILIKNHIPPVSVGYFIKTRNDRGMKDFFQPFLVHVTPKRKWHGPKWRVKDQYDLPKGEAVSLARPGFLSPLALARRRVTVSICRMTTQISVVKFRRTNGILKL